MSVQRARRDAGFTLVELVIGIVLSGILAGVTVAIMVTSLNVVDSAADISHEATDAGLIAAFLYRDAQAAGGTDPLTLADEPGLGVSTDDAGGCKPVGTLVVRFSWIDRDQAGDEHPMTVTWGLDDDGRLVRRACQDGEVADVALGEHVAKATAQCLPDPRCGAGTESVELVVTGTADRSPTTFTLSATLRSVVPAGALPGGVSAPLVLTGGATPSCPELTLAGGRMVVLGNALIDDACGDRAVSGTASLLAPTGRTTSVSGVTDPLAAGIPAAPSCATRTDPAFGSSPSPTSTVVYTQPVVVTGAVALQPGRHVLCRGIEVRAGASLTGSDVFLHVVGGNATVAAGATVDVSAPTSGATAGVALSVTAGDLSIAGGTLPIVIRGAVHVPGGTAAITPGTSFAAGALVADRVTAIGAGPLRLGMPIPTITVEPTELAPAQVGAVYPGVAMIADAGTAPYTWSASGLPAGLTMTAGGLLAGTPTAAGSFVVTITAVDATGLATVTTRTLVVRPPLSIAAPATLSAAQVGLAYSTAITAAGGTSPYTFAATGLPAGLVLSSGGTISGTPTAAGTSTVVVTVTDSIFATSVRTYSLTVRSALAIASPTTLPNGTVGTAWTTTAVTASGGLTPYTFTATGLPPGLSISAAGSISGTPTTGGTYSVTVTARDAAGATAARTFSITVAAASTSTRPFDSLANFQVLAEGNALLGTWEIEGAVGVGGTLTHRNYQKVASKETSTLVVHSGGQPLGLVVGGRIDLTASGRDAELTVDQGWFTVGNADNQSFLAFGNELHLVSAGVRDDWSTPRVLSEDKQTSLPGSAAIVPRAFDFAGVFTGLRATSTRLGGLTSATCSAIGTPRVTVASGNHTVQLEANRVNVWNLTIADITRMNNVEGSVRPSSSTPLVINVLDSGELVMPVRFWNLLRSDGNSPASVLWNFPNAKSVSITEELIGSLLAPSAMVQVVNANLFGTIVAGSLDFRPWNTKLAHFRHAIPCLGGSAPFVSTPGAVPTGQTSAALTPTTFTAEGGTGPYTWTATGLPAGLTLSSAGVLSGTPTVTGTFTVNVTVSDATGAAATRAYTLVVNGPPTISTPTTLPPGQATRAYTATTVGATGGTAPFTWSATGLPAGLSMSADGTVSGTPTTPTMNGPASVTVTVRDAIGASASRTYTLFVAEASVPAGCPLDPSGWRGEYYANTTLSGPLVMCRDDAAVSFNWGGRSPGGSVPATNFSTRWTRRQFFAAGTWEFVKGSDDGLRVFVNGTLVIDDWNLQSYTARDGAGQITLAAGFHTIVVEYFQSPGVSQVQLEYYPVEVTPCGDATSSTWLGSYYSNRSLSGSPTLCRNDATIDFNWDRGSPHTSLPADDFSVRWARVVDFAQGGTYRFTAGSDDGVRVIIDGVRVIDTWRDRAYGLSTADVVLTAGAHTIVYEYYERGGFARATLTWQRL